MTRIDLRPCCPLTVQFWLLGLDARQGHLLLRGFQKLPTDHGSSRYVLGGLSLHSSGLHFQQDSDVLHFNRRAFTVQPFGNILSVLTLTGAQLKDVLEQQFDNPAAGQNRILQVSQGFSYTWDNSKPKGEKVSAMVLNGTLIDAAANYRIAVNNFLADGGDSFTTFRQVKDLIGGDLDIDAFRTYLQGSTISAPAVDRITRLN